MGRARRRRIVSVLACAGMSLFIAVGSTPAGASPEDPLELAPHAHVGLSPMPATPSPASLNLGFKLRTHFAFPPLVTSIEVKLPPALKIDVEGLPRCASRDLEESTPVQARAACGSAMIGRGGLTFRPDLPGQGEFAILDTLVAFNGRSQGRDAILVHGTSVSHLATRNYVIPFVIDRRAAGTTLSAKIPASFVGDLEPEAAAMSSFDLVLKRRYEDRGERRSYLTATCPGPKGKTPSAQFGMAFDDGTNVGASVPMDCR